MDMHPKEKVSLPRSSPPIKGRTIDESSPEAQAILAEFDLATGHLKRHLPFFQKRTVLPPLKGRTIDESSPEAQAILAEFDLETFERKDWAELKRRLRSSS